MPSIYQAKCASCDYESKYFRSGYGALLLDEESDGKQAWDADRRIVVLSHPGESRCLKTYGYTVTSATSEGRFVLLLTRICRDCGTIFQEPKLNASTSFGCLPAVVVAVGVGILVGQHKESVFSVASPDF